MRSASRTVRWWPALALAVYAALLLYLTLRPFDFNPRATFGPHVEWIPFTYVCPIHGRLCPWDRVANVLVFVPLGALAALLPARSSQWPHRVYRISTAAFTVSLVIEATQLFLPSRFPSTADVLLNTLGAWLGAGCVARLVGLHARRGTRRARRSAA